MHKYEYIHISNIYHNVTLFPLSWLVSSNPMVLGKPYIVSRIELGSAVCQASAPCAFFPALCPHF